MAKIIPDIEKAKRSKQKVEEGEIFLLNYLQDSFDTDAEVYFQPCFNGDRPDIVIIKKDVGVIIIEVKDWNLDRYKVDAKNSWLLVADRQLVKSPAAQVFGYRKNLFEVHANGLLDRSIASETFYGLIKVYVYFHKASKDLLKRLYEAPISELREQLDENQKAFTDKKIDYDKYEKRRVYLIGKKKQLERDSGSMAVTPDTLNKIEFAGRKTNPSFEDGVYNELMRLLQPPYHYANEGKPIEYTKPQLRLSESEEGARVKVCGVAGSGKTAVLAKRAVNAHQRHGEDVLILTYNLTLRMFVRDKISEVREDFNWGFFHITSYHKFISSALNSAGVDVGVPDHTQDINTYLEQHFYSNVSLFEGLVTSKYKTILIDEAQDFEPEWQKIIRECFLAEDGEMALFSDEKQNIYERGVDEEKRANVIKGFGRWQPLSKSFRYKQNSPVMRLASAFQQHFLSEKYFCDNDDDYQHNASLIGVSGVAVFAQNEMAAVASFILTIAKREQIHPNDISILSSRDAAVQDLDQLLRAGEQHQERTITSFASKERLDQIHRSNMSASEKREALRKASVSKKIGFNLNSGVMKLATLHSFKGFESPTVFLLVHDTDGPELIYTGLTRARENIVVLLSAGSKYLDFFERYLARLKLVEQ